MSAPQAPALTSFTGNDLRQTGIYAQDQAEFENWRLVGGLRYDWVDQEMTDEDAASTDQKDDGALSGQVGLLYLFDSGFAPYVSYGTSFVPSTQLSANGQVLDLTKGRQIEAGVKYQPEGRDFSLSTAIYRLVETGKPQYAGWTGTSYIYENSGENTFTGFEVEGRTAFDNGLSLVAACTYNHAEVAVNLDSSLIGNTPTTTPRHVASLWVNYELWEDGALGGLSLGGGIRAASESFTSDENTSKNGSAIYLDASLAYDFGVKSPELKGLALSISATNLANRQDQVCNGGY